MRNDALRYGIVTPVVLLNPRFPTPKWELDGTLDDVAVVAQAADDLGFDFLSCSEHVFIPTKAADARGGRYWDPLVTLGFLAASTSRIRLLSHVVVLGYHHPLQVVKSYGSLDQASQGRVILGVGVGTLRPEFKVLGVEFEGRGGRADDALRAIRAAWGKTAPSYAGEHYSFGDVVVDPCGVDRHLPIWVGGSTRRSLRRAIELGDGWVPFGLELPVLSEFLTGVALPDSFELALAPGIPLDPAGDPDGVAAVVRNYRGAGATSLHLRFVHQSRAHYVEQLEAMAALEVD